MFTLDLRPRLPATVDPLCASQGFLEARGSRAETLVRVWSPVPHSCQCPGSRVPPTPGPLLTLAGHRVLLGIVCVVGRGRPFTNIAVQTEQRAHFTGSHFGVCLCWGGGFYLLFSCLKFFTLANQELGHTPWPLASLSQGDLFENAPRPDACAAATGAWPACWAGDPWFLSTGHRPVPLAPELGVHRGKALQEMGPALKITHQRARVSVSEGGDCHL